jgi:hypothetical protein
MSAAFAEARCGSNIRFASARTPCGGLTLTF